VSNLFLTIFHVALGKGSAEQDEVLNKGGAALEAHRTSLELLEPYRDEEGVAEGVGHRVDAGHVNDQLHRRISIEQGLDLIVEEVTGASAVAPEGHALIEGEHIDSVRIHKECYAQPIGFWQAQNSRK